MGHHTVSEIESLQEKVHQHFAENSMLNIVDMECWSAGTADDAEKAKDWCMNNAKGSVSFFKAFDMGNAKNAADALAYFKKIGVKSIDYPSGGQFLIACMGSF